MKANVDLLLIGILALFLLVPGQAQPKKQRNILKKIDQLERVKLLEVLEMDEESSVKFFVRRKEFKERTRFVRGSLDSLQKHIEEKIESGEKVNYKALAGEYTKLEAEMHKLRTDYISSNADILNDEQMAKLIIFERVFRREIQELMFRRGNKRGLSPPEDF